MASIENRIVQMQFDNGAFESKLSTTLRSLDKLNSTISTMGQRNGLEQISQSAKNFNLTGVSASVEGVSKSFIALSTIAITALSNIVNRAVNAGIEITKALSFSSAIDGFREYELQIGSIQTILANTSADGTSLGQVNSALELLNEYSDKTIYNFGEMTRNIGTFTAAGVDLDTSVQSIKGIANLAAISGASSQQASSAMYQLSQAIATGSVKLIDWNSIVNAGMGGEVFQKALFETGKTFGTIADTPIDTTFEEWTAAGNTFRGSLEEGWLTADVLTATLQGFTGELTKAQILSMGYTEAQADEIIRLGELGVDSATKVRTITQLMSTLREALGSGWANTFKLIFGNFEEATVLFTTISDVFSGMVARSADARNSLLEGWAALGGRASLIDGFVTAFVALKEIIAPIKEAFREIFPPLTAERLFAITESFREFAAALRPSETTVENLKRIFTGFFGALEIGWEIVKQGTGFIIDLFKSLTGAGSGGFLSFAANIGDFFTSLNEGLVEGGGIEKFFNKLRDLVAEATPYIIALKDTIVDFFNNFRDVISETAPKITELKDKLVDFFTGLDVVEDPVSFFKELKDDIVNFFDGLEGVVKDPFPFLKDLKKRLSGFFDGFNVPSLDAAGEAVDNIGDKFSGLKGVLDRLKDVWAPFGEAIGRIGDILDGAWDVISGFFSELGSNIADVFKADDFDQVLDVVNVGLLGGLVLILKKFVDNGFKFDLGGGLFSGITRTLDELTGVLSAMQAEIKADALIKIAIALGILALSLLLLASMNSDDLTKALTAMAVGFGQLVISFALLNKIALGPSAAAKMTILAGGLILLAGALLLMALAVKSLSELSWNDLIKGLGGVVVLLGALTLAAPVLSANSGGLIRAGLGMIAIAIALNILALAVKIFATMSWEEMAQGLVGVGVALGIIAAATQLMPSGMLTMGVGILLIAIALNILAGAVKLFSMFSWEEMAKGLVGIGGGLLIIGLAMRLMPSNMVSIGAGLIFVGIALNLIAFAIKQFAGMSWSELGTGLAGLAGSLIILALALKAMSGSIGGAIAIGITAAALLLLVQVIKQFAGIKTGDLIKGLIGLAAVLAVLGLSALIMAPIIPALLGLGAALLIIGAGFALFGLGANLVATAFATLASIGGPAVEVLISVMDAVIERIPALIQAFAVGLLELVQVFLEAAPGIVEAFGTIFQMILQVIIDAIPQVGELIGTFITTMLTLIQEKIPLFVETGFAVLTGFLTGVRDNIGEIVILVSDIITSFLDALSLKIPEIIDSVYNFFLAVFTGVVAKLVDVGQLLVPKGLELLGGLLTGLAQKLPEIGTWFLELPGKILGWIGDLGSWLLEKGTSLISGLVQGIVNKAPDVMNWFLELPGKILDWIGDLLGTLAPKGVILILGFLGGIKTFVGSTLVPWFTSLPGKIIEWIGNLLGTLVPKGITLLFGFLTGIINFAATGLIPWLGDLGSKIIGWIGSLASTLFNAGVDLIQGFLNGVKNKAEEVKDFVSGFVREVGNLITQPWRILSPSRWAMDVGNNFMLGLQMGFSDGANNVEAEVEGMTNNVSNAISKLADDVGDIRNIDPTITPILDLVQFTRDAKSLSSLLPNSTINPLLSYSQASAIAAAARLQETEGADEVTAGPGEVRFEQNIYAPKQLSVGDIYKQTRNQITLAKEELSIP